MFRICKFTETASRLLVIYMEWRRGEMTVNDYRIYFRGDEDVLNSDSSNSFIILKKNCTP